MSPKMVVALTGLVAVVGALSTTAYTVLAPNPLQAAVIRVLDAAAEAIGRMVP